MVGSTLSGSKLAVRYREFITPTPQGLPRLRVLLAFPAMLLVLGAILVGLSINGSSSGAYYSSVYTGADPNLLIGHPEAIRSDEWNTGTSWIISQAQQGMPARNHTFPGGMDAALPYDLPRLDWSVAFRPHLFGYLLFDVNHGTAWRWWLTGFSLIAAAYVMIVTVLPRRPIVAAALSTGFFFSPFFQWWYQSSTSWPVVWALVTMTGLVWAVKTTSVKARVIWAVIVGYITAVMAMGIYLPYILSVAYVVAFFGLGLVVDQLQNGTRWKQSLALIGPTFLGGAVGAAVTGLFLLTKASTVNEFLSTVYPGERLTPSGSGDARSLVVLVSSSFTEALRNSGGFLHLNSSEASTFFLTGIFLIPVALFAIYLAIRGRATIPWVLISLVAVTALFAAFILIPGWDGLAHGLFLDRIPVERLRIGIGLVSLVLVVYVIRFMDEFSPKGGILLSTLTALLLLSSQVVIAIALIHSSGTAAFFASTPLWWFYALASSAAIFFFARRRPGLAVIAFLFATVPSSLAVNPVYLGVFDLRTTAVSRAVVSVDKSNPGAWIGIGNPLITATLVESGVRAYNGVQGAPSEVMWSKVDPKDQYRNQWDRIGFVNWTQGTGEPKVTNPSLDQIVSTFDACSQFAQKNVRYVLTNEALDSGCLTPQSRVTTQTSKYTVFRVIKP